LKLSFYKEQLQSKEDMLAITTQYLMDAQNALAEKNREISAINREIFQSIKFAELIQTSLLPDIEVLKIFVKDAAYSVMQQMGIGGDSIFIKNTSQGIIFGLLDATGHGIPAAMLSIGGILMLNELTSSMDIDNPKVLAKLLNYQLNNTFNTDKSLAHMEGTLCSLSSKTNKLSYCSAKGKAFHISIEGVIRELPVTKNSIGENAFAEYKNFDLEFKTGDKLFLYSDGLTDQFGGPRNKKFSRLYLKRILAENINKNALELRAVIENAHNNWKNNGIQTDDVSFMIIEL